jgi:hypothetical protein
MTQLAQVRCFWRSPENMGLRLWWAIFASLMLGLVYFRQDYTVQGANNRIGALFFMLTAAQVWALFFLIH